jgi:hypothetical protein
MVLALGAWSWVISPAWQSTRRDTVDQGWLFRISCGMVDVQSPGRHQGNLHVVLLPVSINLLTGEYYLAERRKFSFRKMEEDYPSLSLEGNLFS